MELHASPPPPPSFHVVVLGGGISGLSAALALQDLRSSRGVPIHTTLLEGADRLGGVMATHKVGPFLMEEGPETLVTLRPAAVELCARLGVELVQRQEQHSQVFVVQGDRLLPLPADFQLLAPGSLWSLATTPLLSIPGKLRAALDLILPRGSSDLDESVGAFVRRRMGAEVLERLVEPLVGGMHPVHPDQLSLAATMPQFAQLERRYRSVVLGMWAARRAAGGKQREKPRMMTPLHGMGCLATALEGALDQTRLRKGASVESLRRDGARFEIGLTDGERVSADAVLVALPLPIAARLLEGMSPALARSIAAIPTAGGTTVNLVFPHSALPKPPSSSGFVTSSAERRAVKACTFTSAKYPGRSDQDHAVLRAFLRPEPTGSVDRASPVDRAMKDLRELIGLTGEPQISWVREHRAVLPRYELGHGERVLEVERQIAEQEGLALAGNGYHGVGIADCIESGTKAAARIVDQLCP